MKVIIVGSGPAGAFAALGALQAGHHVTMLDVGKTLEEEKIRFKHRLQNTPLAQWSPDDIKTLQTYSPQTQKIHKTVLGSDFAISPRPDDFIRFENFHGAYSHARGGLSNLWGRGIEPPYNGESEHWSFWKELEACYPKVLERLPFAAEEDNLAKVMPLYTKEYKPHSVTTSAQELLDRWNQHEEVLNGSGIHFGKTRLAFHQKNHDSIGCRLCGMCSYGCVYDALYTTNELLDSLVKNYPDRFEYKPDHRVTRFEEKWQNQVIVHCQHHNRAQNVSVEAERLILAAGAIQTTAIAMRSLNVERAALKNSDLIVMPLFKFFGKAAQEEPHHSLSQLTLTVKNKHAAGHARVIHLFGQNIELQHILLTKLPGLLRTIVAPVLKLLVARLYIGVCCFHSADSSSSSVTKENDTIVFSGQKNPQIPRHCWRIFLFLWRYCPRIGLLPLFFTSNTGPVGRSFHYGGSIPANGSDALSSDRNGLIKGTLHVYAADSSVLPSVSGESFTLSIMANAYRIGSNIR